MSDSDRLAESFQQRRGRLRAVAYRMLGSLTEADDALQEVWLRLSRSDATKIEHLDAWLMTVLGRVCLNMLRSRERRREEPLGVRVPDPILTDLADVDPEQEALLAESVGLALLVVIETLTPAERLAFVLHDMFAVPFDEVAAILSRSPAATRQLASRARRRVRGEARVPDADLVVQQHVVDAYFDAARSGDLERLVALLDPDVVARVDAGPGKRSRILRGSMAVARATRGGARSGGGEFRSATVNGAPGALIVSRSGAAVGLMGFTVVAGRIAEINAVTDPERLQRVDLDRN